MAEIVDGAADPQYASMAYLLVRSGVAWVGILVDHPGIAFMDCGSNWFHSGQDDQNAPPSFWFGADQGVAAFYLIAGDSAASVTRRLQRLVGKTPLPPLWSLGRHQCRWGYSGTRDLNELDAAFSAHQFPCDGLWLDIDYMEQYKVFTTSADLFGDRAAELKLLADRGRKIVPILDPGVKVESGYDVATSGLAAGIFCQHPEGQPFIGFVQPGRTWFPDFSLPEARAWWAAYAKEFRDWGFQGAWLDMNDPAVGGAELDDMRFQNGRWDHWTYHNQFATGMAQTTHAGFLAAKPDERPFLLARSAATGSSRYTAVWTGDNWSNWHHLRIAIPCSINLALSGIPFNGPDVPGFGGNADAELAVAWYKAGMLFPFLRNHSLMATARQEPWAFGAAALQTIRHHVRLRYKLLPYLYQLWVAQESDGSAVMRPLFHDFDNADGQVLDFVDDQFLIGAALMQAPLIQQGQQRRSVALPGNGRWMDAGSGELISAGRRIDVVSDSDSTPVYLREGFIIAMQPGIRLDHRNDLCDIELHVILGAGFVGVAPLDYVGDDGLSYGYRRGETTSCTFLARRENDSIHLKIIELKCGWKPLTIRIVAYDRARSAIVTTAAGSFRQDLAPFEWVFSDGPLKAAIGEAVVL
jgi:alpha-glucosidase